jgi:hypothetical protein
LTSGNVRITTLASLFELDADVEQGVAIICCFVCENIDANMNDNSEIHLENDAKPTRTSTADATVFFSDNFRQCFVDTSQCNMLLETLAPNRDFTSPKATSD